MKKVLSIIGLLVATSAYSADDSYMEFSSLGLKYSEPGISANPSAFRGIAGFKSGDNFAYEAVIGVGLSDGKFKYYGVDGTVAINSLYGFYAKASNKVSDDVELFARAGLISMKRDATARYGNRSAAESSSGSGFSYGAGIKYNLTKDNALVVDYMSYYNKSEVKIDGFSVGFNFKF